MTDYARCEAFWSREKTDRPLLAAWVGSYQAPELYPRGLAQLTDGELHPSDLVFEQFVADFEALFAAHRDTGADVPWSAFPLMVVPWVEAIAGCPIFHHDGHVWAEPASEPLPYLAAGGLARRDDWLDKLLEFTKGLVALSDGRFPVALSLMRGPADLLAALRGAEQSIFDLVDSPSDVHSLLAQLTDLWIEVAHAQMEMLPPFDGGYGFSIQNLWGKRPGGWFQDDAVAFWSPVLYRTHLREFETRLAQCMPATGIHLHSAALFTIDDLVEMPELDVIEVNLDDVGLRIPEMIPRFQQVLARKRLLVWGAFSVDDLRLMRDTLPTRGLALQCIGATPKQVRSLVEAVERIWGTV